MADLRVVPKPEGFELRDKRSSKHNKATEWTPADALYDASLVLPSDAKVAVVMWRDASGKPNWRVAGPGVEAVALAMRFVNERA